MYDELIKSLRQCAEASCAGCKNKLVEIGCRGKLQREAADAIEERDKHILTLQHEMMAEAESHTALVERLSKQNKKLEEVVKTALDFIPCWIPVTERLPEDGSDILAVQSYCGEVRIVPANYDRGVWYDCVFNRIAEHITHWMPLPSSPVEE